MAHNGEVDVRLDTTSVNKDLDTAAAWYLVPSGGNDGTATLVSGEDAANKPVIGNVVPQAAIRNGYIKASVSLQTVNTTASMVAQGSRVEEPLGVPVGFSIQWLICLILVLLLVGTVQNALIRSTAPARLTGQGDTISEIQSESGT